MDKIPLSYFCAIFLLSSCNTSNESVIGNNMSRPQSILDGVFYSGEYAYFESKDGRQFELRLLDKDIQNIFAPFIPTTFGNEKVCVKLKIGGDLGQRSDSPGRQIFNVREVYSHTKIHCRN